MRSSYLDLLQYPLDVQGYALSLHATSSLALIVPSWNVYSGENPIVHIAVLVRMPIPPPLGHNPLEGIRRSEDNTPEQRYRQPQLLERKTRFLIWIPKENIQSSCLHTWFSRLFVPYQLVRTADIRVLQIILGHIPDPVTKVEGQLHTYAVRSATADPLLHGNDFKSP